ncbi:MAG: hypothetical protein QXY20_09480 [Thermofilum sp.]|uniref:hypothetical protein n=1 Tax=Thermofilum sp. TaxID=1961369 RepID=UPI003161D953
MIVIKNMTEVQTQNPAGEGGQASPNQTPQLVEVSLGFGTYRNTFEYALLYSLKKRNFIRGHSHKGLDWSVDYRIYPGRYVILHSWGYLDRRGATLLASLIFIDEKGEIKPLESVEVGYVVPGHSDNPALRAFFDALPGYHDRLIIPYLSQEGPTWEEIKAAVKKIEEEPTDPEA